MNPLPQDRPSECEKVDYELGDHKCVMLFSVSWLHLQLPLSSFAMDGINSDVR
jgi:hypothetical protein